MARGRECLRLGGGALPWAGPRLGPARASDSGDRSQCWARPPLMGRVRFPAVGFASPSWSPQPLTFTHCSPGAPETIALRTPRVRRGRAAAQTGRSREEAHGPLQPSRFFSSLATLTGEWKRDTTSQARLEGAHAFLLGGVQWTPIHSPRPPTHTPTHSSTAPVETGESLVRGAGEPEEPAGCVLAMGGGAGPEC